MIIHQVKKKAIISRGEMMAPNQPQEGYSCCEMLLTARARSWALGVM